MQNQWNPWQLPTPMPQPPSGIPTTGTDPMAMMHSYMQYYNQPAPSGYTTEQWSTAQQQNWSQWQQWQEQYQQWQSQYGDKYQETMKQYQTAETAQLPPLPTAQPPPLPKDDSIKPPLPPDTSDYNFMSMPPPHQNNLPLFPSKQTNTRQMMQDPNLPSTSIHAMQLAERRNVSEKKTSNQPFDSESAKKLRLDEDKLVEIERNFDAQFKEWEEQFNIWKQKNANHPDKEQYKQYEAKWTSWREKLLERREQMRRKREQQKQVTKEEDKNKDLPGGDKILNLLSNTDNQGLINNLLGIGKKLGLTGKSEGSTVSQGDAPPLPPRTVVSTQPPLPPSTSLDVSAMAPPVMTAEMNQTSWAAQQWAQYSSNNYGYQVPPPTMQPSANPSTPQISSMTFLQPPPNFQNFNQPPPNFKSSNDQSSPNKSKFSMSKPPPLMSFDITKKPPFEPSQSNVTGVNRSAFQPQNTDGMMKRKQGNMNNPSVQQESSSKIESTPFNKFSQQDENFADDDFGSDDYSDDRGMSSSFGPGDNRFGSGNNRFGSGGDRFGSGNDRFDSEKNRFASESDRFGPGNDRFGLGNNRLGSDNNRPVLGNNRFGSNNNRFGQNNDRRSGSDNRDSFGRNNSFQPADELSPELRNLMEKRKAAMNVFKPSNSFLSPEKTFTVSLSESFKKITGDSPFLSKSSSDFGKEGTGSQGFDSSGPGSRGPFGPRGGDFGSRPPFGPRDLGESGPRGPSGFGPSRPFMGRGPPPDFRPRGPADFMSPRQQFGPKGFGNNSSEQFRPSIGLQDSQFKPLIGDPNNPNRNKDFQEMGKLQPPEMFNAFDSPLNDLSEQMPGKCNEATGSNFDSSTKTANSETEKNAGGNRISPLEEPPWLTDNFLDDDIAVNQRANENTSKDQIISLPSVARSNNDPQDRKLQPSNSGNKDVTLDTLKRKSNDLPFMGENDPKPTDLNMEPPPEFPNLGPITSTPDIPSSNAMFGGVSRENNQYPKPHLGEGPRPSLLGDNPESRNFPPREIDIRPSPFQPRNFNDKPLGNMPSSFNRNDGSFDVCESNDGPRGFMDRSGNQGSSNFDSRGMDRLPFGPRGMDPQFGPRGMNNPQFGPRGMNNQPFGPRGMDSQFGPAGASRAPFGPRGMDHNPFGPRGMNNSFAPRGIDNPPFGPRGSFNDDNRNKPGFGPRGPFLPDFRPQNFSEPPKGIPSIFELEFKNYKQPFDHSNPERNDNLSLDKPCKETSFVANDFKEQSSTPSFGQHDMPGPNLRPNFEYDEAPESRRDWNQSKRFDDSDKTSFNRKDDQSFVESMPKMAVQGQEKIPPIPEKSMLPRLDDRDFMIRRSDIARNERSLVTIQDQGRDIAQRRPPVMEFQAKQQFNYNHGGLALERRVQPVVEHIPAKVIDYGHAPRKVTDYLAPAQTFDYSHGNLRPSVPEHQVPSKRDFRNWEESEQNLLEYSERMSTYEFNIRTRQRAISRDNRMRDEHKMRAKEEYYPREDRGRWTRDERDLGRDYRRKNREPEYVQSKKGFPQMEQEKKSCEDKKDKNEALIDDDFLEDISWDGDNDRSLKDVNSDKENDDERFNGNNSQPNSSQKNGGKTSLKKSTFDDDHDMPEAPPPPMAILDITSTSNIAMVEDLLCSPGRQNRPLKVAIILRGPPGSGKSFVAKMIKDKEAEQGGSAPRILSIDDYFLVEGEVETTDDNGKKLITKEMVYEFEEAMEPSYTASLVKAFKKNVTDGFFNFIILDSINEKISDYEEMWSFAKSKGFKVFICEMEMDVQICLKRNTHKRTEEEINRIVDYFEPTPNYHQKLDVNSMLQKQTIEEVQMEDNEEEQKQTSEPSDDNQDSQDTSDSVGVSKWERMEAENKLDRLDGLAKRKPEKEVQTMEDFLQVPDYYDMEDDTGRKRVRWADLEERKEQEKMRRIGFVVGHTNWQRMMDPTKGSSALTRTKYI